MVGSPGDGWRNDLADVRGVANWSESIAPTDIEAAAETLGRRCIVLDCSEVEDREQFLEICAQAFALPEWFAMTWDALAECLADLDASDGLIIVVSEWAEFAINQPQEFATAVDVLTDTARRFAREAQPCAVLLLGYESDDVDGWEALSLLDDEDDEADLEVLEEFEDDEDDEGPVGPELPRY